MNLLTLIVSGVAIRLIAFSQRAAADSRLFRVLVDELQGADLHHGMFIPTIEGQGTEEQKAKWLPLANRSGLSLFPNLLELLVESCLFLYNWMRMKLVDN